MGQAVADLPDPMDSLLSPPTSAAGTDDLLSQLAGDEIDRLLAEADAGRPPESAPARVPAPATTAPAGGPSEQDLDALLSELNTTASTTPTTPATPSDGTATLDASVVPAAPAAEPEPSHPGDDELDALLSALNQAPPAPGTSAADPTTAKSLTDQVPDVLAKFGANLMPPDDKIPSPDLPAAADAPDGLMSSAERDALSLSNLADATDAAERLDAEAAASTEAAARPARFGVAIRLLELINAPAAAVPDAARDVLGKAAILTLVNSIAVLVYVLLFRH